MKRNWSCNKIQILSAILFLFVSSVSYSQKTIDVHEVERQVTEKISRALSALLTEKQYILDVSVQKTVIENQKAEIEKQKRGLALSDAEKAQEDFVLFEKLGLEVPIGYGETEQTAEKQPEEEERISRVDVTIYLDEDIPESVSKNVRQLLEKLSFSMPVRPKMDFVSMKFQAEEIQVEEEEKKRESASVAPPEKTGVAKALDENKEVIELASKFADSLGFIVSAFMLCIFAFLLFGKYSKFQKDQTTKVIESNKEIAETAQQANQEASLSSSSEKDSSSVETNSSSQGVVGTGSEEDALGASVERFKSYFLENEVEAATLLKKWVNLKPDGAGEALVLLAQKLDPETLLKTFNLISMEERKRWRSSIASSSLVNLNVGARFIDEQIIAEIIVPNDLIDEKTKSLLYGLDAEKCSKLIVENQELAPLLMNTLSSGFIVKVLSYLEPEVIEKLTLQSVQIDVEELKKQDGTLQEAIKNYTSDEISSPFSDKIVDILPFVDISKEEYFLKAIGRSGDRAKLLTALQRFIPGKAIFDLSGDMLKKLLSSMNQKVLVELLIVLSEEKSAQFLNVLAPEGSKKREMLDLEIGNINKDEVRLAKLKKDKEKIEGAFIKFARGVINKNEAMLEEMDPVLESLCSEYLGGEAAGGQQSVA